MKRIIRIAAFIVVIATTVIILTAGTTKEYRSDGGDRDLVEELYDQAVKQNSNLESLEEDIEKFYKKKDEAMGKYNSFVYYNSRYYTDAKSKASRITDAATRQKTNDIISKSETAYNAKLTNWQNTIATLNAGEKELSDLHVLLKIATTEPMIQKYQNTSLPDNSKLNEANSDLQRLIERIKAINR